MNDPYSVLGVSPTADDEQIRDAYRRLAERYTSSDFAGDPMAEVAAERMRELDEAYDAVMAQRRAGGNSAGGPANGGQNNAGYSYREAPQYAGAGSGTGQGGGYGGAGYANPGRHPAFNEVRLMLSRGDVFSAEQRLLAMSPSMRGAEWNFLMGNVCQRKGWLDEAYNYFGRASSAEPSNPEYAAAFNNASGARAHGAANTSYGAGRASSYDGCMGEMCSFLQCYCCSSMCLDACCSCR